MSKTSNRKFGVEIECYSSTRLSMHAVADLLRAAGVQVDSSGTYTHTVMRGWKLTPDGSLNMPYAMEIVSPVLSGEDGAAQVRKVCEVLNANGIKVNRQCGLHVHVDGRDLAFPQLRNVLKMFAKYESQFDALLPDSRRNNGYCDSNLRTWGGSLDEAFARIERTRDLNGLRALNLNNRYHKLNLESMARYGSLEFRMHSGTVDSRKILAWVGMLTGFVDRAAETKRVEKEGAGKLENLLRFADAASRRFYRTRARVFSGDNTSAAVMRARSANEDSEQ